MIYETNYKKLAKLFDIEEFCKSEPGTALTLESQGFMDLKVDHLGTDDENLGVRISLAHNFIQNGDVMADPDMEIRVIPEVKMAEALTFQMSNPPIYQMVYPEPGKVDLRAKKELNSFLHTWLNNLLRQGHAIPPELYNEHS